MLENKKDGDFPWCFGVLLGSGKWEMPLQRDRRKMQTDSIMENEGCVGKSEIIRAAEGYGSFRKYYLEVIVGVT